MPKIGIFFAPQNKRSKIVAQAMSAGLNRLGVPHDLRSSLTVRTGHDYSIALHYGLAQGLRQIFRKQKEDRRAIYIDLGYWGRRKRTRFDGFHKVVLNDRHPTAYFQNIRHPSDRFHQFRIPVKSWRKAGRHILVAGMSNKAAAEEGFQPHQWERETINELRKLTDRPIVYRPKPNWDGARPISGSLWGKSQTLEQSLQNCHAVVAHHSNVAVDALLAGVPCICPFGIASPLSGKSLDQIEDPPTPSNRSQWAADVAYTQWSIDEMERGDVWRYLDREGLVG